jgi:hypothetical protein
MQVTALRRTDHPSKESYRLSVRSIILELINSERKQAGHPNPSRYKKKKKKRRRKKKNKKKRKRRGRRKTLEHTQV